MVYLHSHHKCASRWMIEYFKAVASLNNVSFYNTDYTSHVRRAEAEIVFFGNSSYEAADKEDLGGVHFVRNPLSLIISAYYSHLKTHPDDHWPELRKQRDLLQQVGRDEGMYLSATFLERTDINEGAIGPLASLRTWNYDDSRMTTVRIEDFCKRPSQTIQHLAPLTHFALPPDSNFTFEHFSGGRPTGVLDANSYYRSGFTEEWMQISPPALIKYVQLYYTKLLVEYYPEVALFGVDSNKPFYQLDEDVRLSLANIAIAKRSTVIERWSNLQDTESLAWKNRLAKAACLLGDCESVADIGCGTMGLETLIGPKIRYIPIDVAARDDRTIVADLNKESLPEVVAQAAVMLGLIEYIHDVDDLLSCCAKRFDKIVLSYNCMQTGDTRISRRAHAWVNDLKEDEIESKFRRAGWSVCEKDGLGRQTIWALRRTGAVGLS